MPTTVNELFFTSKDGHLAPSENELSTFMIDLFDIWFNDKSEDQISIEPFTTIISSFWGENAGDCCYKSTCASFFIVETNGNISLCSRLNFLENNLGNLNTKSWKEILTSDVIKQLNKRILEPNTECKKCKWYKACNCGCTALAYESYGNMYDKTFWCEARKKLFTHIYNRLESLN